MKLDVTDEQGVINTVKEVKDYFDKIDILCNNTGSSVLGDFLTYSTETWDSVVDTYLKLMFLMSREV